MRGTVTSMLRACVHLLRALRADAAGDRAAGPAAT